MISLDPLILLLLAEAVLVFGGLALYLFLKLRNVRTADGLPRQDIKQLFQQRVERLLREIKPPGDAAAQPSISNEQDLQTARVDYLRGLAQDLPKTRDGDELWNSMNARFETALRTAATKGARINSEEIVRLNDIIIKQAAKIADLYGYKDLFNETKKKLESLQSAQDEVRKRLASISESEREIAVVREMQEAVERVNKELGMCVTVLEKENQRLTDDYVAWQKELNQPAEQRTGGEEQLGELRKALKEKNAELEAMNAKLLSLEKEYLVLYEKHMANNETAQG